MALPRRVNKWVAWGKDGVLYEGEDYNLFMDALARGDIAPTQHVSQEQEEEEEEMPPLEDPFDILDLTKDD